MSEWLKILLILGSLVGLLGVVRQMGRRCHWHVEWQRKTMHVALGGAALSFPWLFGATWPVWVICGAGALILVALRSIPYLHRRLGGALHDVDRDSTGELLFAATIALLFELAHATPVAYVIPLAILTFADTAAALWGTAWGRHSFVIPFGHKSWEGVAAFAVTALGVTIPLLAWFAGLAWPQLFLVALTVAALTTLTEAIAWHGHDNALAPLVAYLTLTLTLTEPPSLLLYQLSMVVATWLILMPIWQSLPPHPTLTGLLTVAALWLGGPLLWLPPLLGLLFIRLYVALHENRSLYTGKNIDSHFNRSISRSRFHV